MLIFYSGLALELAYTYVPKTQMKANMTDIDMHPRSADANACFIAYFCRFKIVTNYRKVCIALINIVIISSQGPFCTSGNWPY